MIESSQMTRNALKLLTGSNLFLGVPGPNKASQLEKWNLHMLSQNHNITEYLRHLLKVIYKGIGSGPHFSSFFHPQPAPELARFGGTVWPILAVIKWEAWRLGEFRPWKPESKRRAWYCKTVQYIILHVYITSYHFDRFFYWVKVCRMKAGYA